MAEDDNNETKVYDIIIRDINDEQKNKILKQYLLDGVKRHIRLWKLGSLEHKVYPKREAFEKLAEILEKWDGVSTLDLIWDDMLNLEIHTI